MGMVGAPRRQHDHVGFGHHIRPNGERHWPVRANGVPRSRDGLGGSRSHDAIPRGGTVGSSGKQVALAAVTPMEPFHVAHLVALGVWLGVVITEVLFEFTGSDADSLRAAARFHYNVDKFGEVPILCAVVITGLALTVRAWPLTPLHFVKIATSLIAVGANVICTMWVF